jgi:hypothetical protein
MIEYKDYKIEGDKTFGMFLIKTIGGGSLPEILRGSYTKTGEAKLAIDQYRRLQEERDNRPAPVKKVKLTPREVNDGATENDSGD